jgi:predicted dehydrogenase
MPNVPRPDPTTATPACDALTRRGFMARTAAATGASVAAPVLGPLVLTAGSPNEKLGVAVVACGGMGGGNPGTAANERCVALCDVDEKKIADAAKKIAAKVPNPKVYHDYRKMIDECHKDMDVILIATPDHNHAPAAIRAIRLGKHAFAQKPLAHNIYECRTLAKEAREKKVHTQMGNQGHCGEGYRVLCEYLWAGAIGKVTETHTILGRSFGGSGGRPAGKPVPAGLHWDEWLGPAPQRDYHDGLHAFGWRSWRDFGTGTLGDMACHCMDGIFWALKIGEAKSFTIECLAQTGGSAEMFPQNNAIRWDIPARGDMPPLKVFAYDNAGQKPEFLRNLETETKRKFGGGTVYVGEKGCMVTGTYGENPTILPEEKHKAFTPPPKTIPRVSGGPIGDLFQAIRGGTPPCSNFADSAGPFSEFILSGQLAMFAGVGKKVEWDVTAMTCKNIPELNKIVKREYRKGWEV